MGSSTITLEHYYILLFLIPYFIGGVVYYRSTNIWKTAFLFAACQLLIVYSIYYKFDLPI